MINYEPAVGPFSHSNNSSVRIMYIVILTLLPTIVFAVYQFGQNTGLVILSSCVTAIVCEWICLKVLQRDASSCLDGSALLTAILLALSLPPTIPVWLAVFGTAFAIIVGKHIYGGLGQNVFNPAMLARVMLLICFPVEMTYWIEPSPIDFSHNQVAIPDSWHLIDGVTSATALSHRSADVPLQQLFFGSQSGSLGETSAFLILLGGAYMIYRRIIHWAIPLFFFIGLGVPALLTSLVSPENYLPVTTHLFSGAAMLGAFYIATDLVTSPTSIRGQMLYGASCGLLVWLIRSFGSYPEGVAFAVLIMNATTPVIDHYLRPNIFGSQAVVMEDK